MPAASLAPEDVSLSHQLQKSDASFLTVKPMGREGDWKSDGFSLNTGTVFQCYAPEELTGAEAARKVREDFQGACKCWQEKMLAWTFVRRR
jgi:hypothetical protein